MIMPSTWQIRSLSDMNYHEEIIEDGQTLEENALIKAEHIYTLFQTNCFSEDTGLEVDSLNNEPGVVTARYAGPQKNASDNMSLLLKNLEDKSDRGAQFRAIICLIYNDQKKLFEGICRGHIAHEPKGGMGFGYDPVFIPEGYKRTFAELGDKVKKELSHRTLAFRKMISWLQEQI